MGDDGTKKIKTRVNRIAGQVAGIRRMVDEGRYCVEILNQIAAVRSALDALGIELLTRHLESCVLGHGSGHEHDKAKADDERVARRRGADGPLPVPEMTKPQKVDIDGNDIHRTGNLLPGLREHDREGAWAASPTSRA